jgi:hypothetical protein
MPVFTHHPSSPLSSLLACFANVETVFLAYTEE